MTSCSILRSLVAVLGCIVAVTGTAPALAASSERDEAPSTDEAATTEAEASEKEEAVATNVPEKKTVSSADKSYSHQGQFHLRLALGMGYRIVMRYDQSPPCSKTLNDDGTQKTLCGYGAPLDLDAAIGYAPLAGVEPFLWGRFGLTHESVSGTSPLVILGGGVRLYTMSDSAFKFFIEPAVGVELEQATSSAANKAWQYKQDFIVRLTVGPQLDFSRNVGVYAAAGLTAGMLRALQSWMDLHFGLQARFP